VRRLLGLVVVVAAGVAIPAAPTHAAPADPPFSADPQLLAAALDCPHPFTHPEHEPVLLVHGTFTSGHEQFSWNYELFLPERGYDYCVVTYPDRGLGDMQVSAEYIAYAVNEMYARTGRKVDMVGHSQGGLMPRWAIKWWPSVQAHLDDFVLLASPNQGVELAESADQNPFPAPAVSFQFDSNSNFMQALNAGDETPGAVDYSSIYSEYDELVRPVEPVPTAGLDWQHEGPNVRNLSVQDVCPGRLVEHLTIGTTDMLSIELTLDALSHPGPVDPSRLTVAPTCVIPDQFAVPAQLQAFAEQFQRSFVEGSLPDFHLVTEEPPLKPYALQPAPEVLGQSVEAPSNANAPDDQARRTDTLPATGGPGWPLLAGTAALLLALAIRAGLARPKPAPRRIPR
jgi:triacylglycerol esterase/lipase EstA (alpha/beta hydrolase family)